MRTGTWVLLIALLVARWSMAEEPIVPLLSLAEHALHTLKVPGSADFLVLEGDDAWVTNQGRVEKLKAGSSKPVVTVQITEPCGAMAIDFGSRVYTGIGNDPALRS